jgi:uncharacterized repeat protein (TIGR02543 family)
VLLAVFFVACGAEAATNEFYYAQSYSPYAMYAATLNANGTVGVPTTVYTATTGSPEAVAVDTQNGYLYFSDPNYMNTGVGSVHAIYRANLDGSNVQPFITGVYANGLAVDPVHGYIFYSQSFSLDATHNYFNVVRASLSNLTQTVTIYTSAAGSPEAVAVDPNGNNGTGYIYYSDPYSSVHAIYRANLDGTGAITLISNVHARGLAVDGIHGKIYYSEAYSPTFQVCEANLDGLGTPSVIYTSGTGSPKAVALDLAGNSGNGYLYFSDPHSSVAKIFRSNLDGSGQTAIVSNVNADGIGVYDITPPNAPIVTGTTPTSNTTPTWTWTSGGNGGNGTFRYKLDDSNLASGATTTTATSFTPGSAMALGSHTLYVQERDAAGNWSASGSFTIVIGQAQPCIVTFVSDGTTYTTETVNSGATATQPTVPTKQGSIFLGWYTDSTLNTLFDFSTPITSDIILYAAWSSKRGVESFPILSATPSYFEIVK